MRRYELTDEQWSRIEHLLPSRPGDPGTMAKDNRLFVHAVLWIACSGAPWRDLPERFGFGNGVFQRFNRKTPREYDNAWYNERNQVERFLNRIKRFRRVATRSEKIACNFLGVSSVGFHHYPSVVSVRTIQSLCRLMSGHWWRMPPGDVSTSPWVCSRATD